MNNMEPKQEERITIPDGHSGHINSILEPNLRWKASKRAFFVLFMIHFFGFFIYRLAIIWRIGWNPVKRFGGNLKNLTFWNHILILSYFLLCLICDIFAQRLRRLTGLLSPKAAINRRTILMSKTMDVRDHLYHSLVIPIAWFVAISYWTLFLINRELVDPKKNEKKGFWWYKHITHTLIVPLPVIEGMIYFHHQPKRFKAIETTLIFVLSYFVWIMYLGIGKDIWVYGFMKKMNWSSRIIFSICASLFVLFLYFINSYIYDKIWISRKKDNLQTD